MSSEEEQTPPIEATPYAWLVRPCENYWEEHTLCKTFKHRFYQYYIDGELADCSHWKQRAKLCDKVEFGGDKIAMQNLIEMEKQRYTERMGPHLANNVWERRTEPPKDWVKKLPESHEKRIEESYLKQLINADVQPPSFSCVIL